MRTVFCCIVYNSFHVCASVLKVEVDLGLDLAFCLFFCFTLGVLFLCHFFVVLGLVSSMLSLELVSEEHRK